MPASGNASRNSACSRVQISGFANIWYVAIAAVLEVVRLPATSRLKTSLARRLGFFCSAGKWLAKMVSNISQSPISLPNFSDGFSSEVAK